MKRREAREMSNEEFDAWIAARNRQDAVAEAADEEGGPRLSLVPVTERGEVWPTDLLPPAPDAPPSDTDTDEAPIAATPFDGVALEDSRKRLAGWSADRQRVFLTNLAETGSVHLAAATARLSARSAYKLRARARLRGRVGHGGTAGGRATVGDGVRPRDQWPAGTGVAGR